jgi:hypothetical protein
MSFQDFAFRKHNVIPGEARNLRSILTIIQDFPAIAEVQDVLNAANAGAVCRPGIALPLGSL